LSNSATHSVMTARGDSTPFEGNPLRTPHHHLGPVTQDDKVRECEIISTFALTLPESTCAQGRSRSFHWDQGTNCQHIDKGVHAEYHLLTLPGHVWTVTQDDKVRECEVKYTLTLTLQFGKSLVRPNMLMIMYGHGSQRQLLHVIRRSVYHIAHCDVHVALLHLHYVCPGIKVVLPVKAHDMPNICNPSSHEHVVMYMWSYCT
jgi:hypothetical protein